MNRFITVLVIGGLLCGCNSKESTSEKFWDELVYPLYEHSQKPFYHGVASGDPLPNAVIIWTRVTPPDSLQPVSVVWEVSENENFLPVLKSDSLTTSFDRDFTVKVDVTGLLPGHHYYYRFKALNATSK